METAGYVIYAIPGDLELEVSYTYTRPDVLHKTVTTTWESSKVEVPPESGKEYSLTFEKKEEQFKMIRLLFSMVDCCSFFRLFPLRYLHRIISTAEQNGNGENCFVYKRIKNLLEMMKKSNKICLLFLKEAL